jgi:hypothetical protein
MCNKKKSRPKWPAKWREAVFYKTNNPYKAGHCWHCGAILSLNKGDSTAHWHIDHYPVAYRDIENQCCLGVTDPLDIDNLVPSCIECNVGHRFEKRYRCYCGRSQPYCQKWLLIPFISLLFVLIKQYQLFILFNQDEKQSSFYFEF